MVILYAIVLAFFTVYTYVLVDPNITFINHKLWTSFREVMVQIGYHNRPLSFSIYFVLVILLFILHRKIIANTTRYKPFLIALITGGILLFSYPFLSHDFFNYMFDAKILTFYGENPYLMRPMDFPEDPWLRFMHWTHRTYPYGPVFLVLSLIPSFAAFGTFLLHYMFLKSLTIGFYLLMILFIARLDRKKALEFATHPYILIEGLINAHNDLLGLAIGVVGFYYIWQSSGDDLITQIVQGRWKSIFTRQSRADSIGRFCMLASGGIKYLTLPYLFISKNADSIWNKGAFLLTLGLILYLSLTREFQQWYILTFFLFGLIWKDSIQKWSIFLFGLLMSYFPFIYLGGWAEESHVQLKFIIILTTLFLNIGVVWYTWFSSERQNKNIS